MWPTTKLPKMPPSNAIASSMSASCRWRAGRTMLADRISWLIVIRLKLIGTPDEIIGKLETLRRCGVEYVIMNCGGSRESLHRFAHEIMPTFSDEPAKVRTA